MERGRLAEILRTETVGGALLMALGGAFAVSDRRYALAARKESQETAATKPEPVATVATTPASGTAE